MILDVSNTWADDWITINSGKPPDVRHEHTIVTLPNGRIMLFSGGEYQGKLKNDLFVYGRYGESGALNKMWTYDTESNKWYEPVVDSKQPARSEHISILQSDGNIHILGGQDSECNNLNDSYPNPFYSEIIISFSIPKISKVECSIYNIKGKKIKTLYT